jgi:hypothetical protein
MKALYKYPQGDFPYAKLVDENRSRNRRDFEYELLDTGAFEENRYFDVFVEYAKSSAEDLLIKITAVNRGPSEADLSILPTIWFRNTWSWGRDDYRPSLRAVQQLAVPKEFGIAGSAVIEVDHRAYGKRWLLCEGEPELLFTENYFALTPNRSRAQGCSHVRTTSRHRRCTQNRAARSEF